MLEFSRMTESKNSVTWVITAVMILIAVFGWGFLAASYAGAHQKNLRDLSKEDRQDFPLPQRNMRWAMITGPIIFLRMRLDKCRTFPASLHGVFRIGSGFRCSFW